jgi:hypothetical protein
MKKAFLNPNFDYENIFQYLKRFDGPSCHQAASVTWLICNSPWQAFILVTKNLQTTLVPKNEFSKEINQLKGKSHEIVKSCCDII